VLQAEVIIDRQTGQSRRFGFVEMATEDQADRAMAEMNGATVVQRSLRVSPARKREAAPVEGNQRLRLRLPFRLVASRQRQPHEE
jgi:RNA recognition motif-containing protein